MPLQNEHLEHVVNEMLVQSNELSSQRVQVIAEGGVVTLGGDVQSFRRKLAAQSIAESCEGVTAVVNELTVTPPDSATDSKTAYEANCRLAADSRLVNEAIRVDARNGQVTLTGYVTKMSNINNAADLVSAVSGVREVQSLLIVNPDRVLTNKKHVASIRKKLAQTIGIDHEEILLTVVDATARVSGRVDELWKKEAVEKIVRQFKILNVCNEIVVNPNR